MDQAKEKAALLRAKINRETAKIPWKDAQRFFAQGRVIVVSQELDLVEIAVMAALDRSDELQVSMSEGRVTKVSDEQARRWLESDVRLWTTVVKPWVLVRAPGQDTGHQLS